MKSPLSPRPMAIPVNPGIVPSTLIALPHWLIWRYEWRTGKWTKVPYTASGSGKAKSTDPRTWSRFEVALRRWQAGDCDGISFALTHNLHIAGLDIDHCRVCETGEISTEALDVVHVMDTYTEVSPSGTGLRSLARGDKPTGRCKRGNYEMYQEGRYLSITGCHLEGTPLGIEPRQEAINVVHARFLADYIIPSQKPTPQTNESSFIFEDDHLLERVFSAKNGAKVARLWQGDTCDYARDGNEGHSEADSALCFELAFWTKDATQIDRLFRRSGLYRPKWDERHYGDGQTYGEVTIARAIAQVQDHWTPVHVPTVPHSPDGNPWERTNTLPFRPYRGYRGLTIRGGSSHG